jgi:hypothetical protein
MCDDARAEERAKAMQQMADKDSALTGGKANFRGSVSEDMASHRGARPRGRVDTDQAIHGPQPSYQPPDD